MPRHQSGLGAGGFPTANKLLMRYEIDRAQKIHQQKLNQMKHRLDVKEPKKYNHLILRLKQIQKEEERQAEIDHENKLLLSKMTHVMKYGGNIDNWNTYESRSLNYPLRERQNEDIARENLGIARRLETVRPKLNMLAWEKDYQKHAYLKRLWSDSSKDFGDFTPRYRSRMSKARSLENSLDEGDDSESMDAYEEKRFPQLEKSRKDNLRHTKSETNGPVSNRRGDEFKGGKPGATKLPKIIPHKARSIRSKRSWEDRQHDDDSSQEYSPYQSKPANGKDNSEKKDRVKADNDNLEKKDRVKADKDNSEKKDHTDSSRDNTEKKDRVKAEKDNSRDNAEKAYKTDKKVDNNKTKTNKVADKSGTKNTKQQEKSNGSNKHDPHSQSQTSFQSSNLPTNDMERVETLISEEKDKTYSEDNSDTTQTANKENDNSASSGENNAKGKTDNSQGQLEDDTSKSNEHKNSVDDGNTLENHDNSAEQHTVNKQDKDSKEDIKQSEGGKESVKASENESEANNQATDNSVDNAGISGTNKDTGKDDQSPQTDTQGDRKKKTKADGTSGAGNKEAGSKEEDGSDVAQLFKIAKQLGKPEEIFIKTLIKKSHKQRMKTKSKFREKYDLDLIKELKNGLGPAWERLIDAILQERGDTDSYALFDALSTTDMCDVVELLCSRDNAAIAELKESYRKEFSISLEEDIADRTEPPIQTLLLALQKGSKDESSDVDLGEARKDALALHEAGDGRWDSDSGLFIKLLNTRSYAHIQAIVTEYKAVCGQGILQAMKADCPKDFYQILSTLVHCLGSPPAYFADQIHKHKLASDQILINILVTRSEVDMPAIRKVYKANYGVELTEEIKSKPHPTQKCLIELASKVPPGFKHGAASKQKGAKGAAAPQPQQVTKKPPAGKKTEATKTKGDEKESTAVPSKTDSKPKAQSQKSKQDNPDTTAATQGKKKEDGQAAKKKKPVAEKDDGDHNGTVRPVGNFRPDDDCEKLNGAMAGIGTDEQVIVAIIPKRSNKQRQKLKQTYEQKYKKNLMIDLESELSGDTEEIVLALMMSRPEYDAYILHEAVEGLGTSEATLIGVLGSRSAQEMKAIKEHYKKTYKTDMEMDITRDTDGHLKALFTQLARGERQEETAVNASQAKQDAEALYQKGESPIDPSSEVFQTLLSTKNQYQVKATFEEYQKLAGQDIYAGLSKASLGDDEESYCSIVKAVEDPVAFHTEKLHSCFNNMGTNDNMLIRIIVSRSEIDTRDIKAKYMELYSQSLTDVIGRECRGDYKNLLLAVLSENEGSDDQKKGKDKAPATTGPTVKPCSPFNPMEDGARLHNAMKGFGTNEDVILEILPRRSNDQRQEIQAKYEHKYRNNLREQLKSELRGDFEEIVLALMMTPVEYDAHCLHAAVDGLGTSEGILIGILSTRTGKELAVIRDQYKKTYGTDLQNDITSDVSGGLEDMLVEILKCEREQGQTVNQELAKQDATKLYKDGQISIDPKDETFMAILAKRNRAQVRATFEEYKKLTGKDIYYGIEKAFIGDTERGYRGLAKALEDPVQYYAEKLKDSFDGFGTNDTQLIRIIVSRSEIDLLDIKNRYKSLYKKTLKESIESECGGDYKRMLLAIIGDHVGNRIP